MDSSPSMAHDIELPEIERTGHNDGDGGPDQLDLLSSSSSSDSITPVVRTVPSKSNGVDDTAVQPDDTRPEIGPTSSETSQPTWREPPPSLPAQEQPLSGPGPLVSPGFPDALEPESQSQGGNRSRDEVEAEVHSPGHTESRTPPATIANRPPSPHVELPDAGAQRQDAVQHVEKHTIRPWIFPSLTLLALVVTVVYSWAMSMTSGALTRFVPGGEATSLLVLIIATELVCILLAELCSTTLSIIGWSTARSLTSFLAINPSTSFEGFWTLIRWKTEDGYGHRGWIVFRFHIRESPLMARLLLFAAVPASQIVVTSIFPLSMQLIF